ncbi:hypothetical protein GCM10011504_05230 [Siccirubricoccus deserti]|nr:hypothetical protein GCM10011504_05230 [Siccirubricoccus deserti]
MNRLKNLISHFLVVRFGNNEVHYEIALNDGWHGTVGNGDRMAGVAARRSGVRFAGDAARPAARERPGWVSRSAAPGRRTVRQLRNDFRTIPDFQAPGIVAVVGIAGCESARSQTHRRCGAAEPGSPPGDGRGPEP